MNHNNRKNQKGFAALISTVLISSILLVMAAGVAGSAFHARFDALTRENKKISRELSEACVQAALFELAQDKNYTVPTGGEEIIVDGARKCKICEVSYLEGGEWEIFSRAAWQNTFTNLKTEITLSSDEFTITASKEFAPYSGFCIP